MLIFLCICAGLTTVALIVVAVHLILALTQLRRTSRTLESLAANANEKVDAFNDMTNTVRSVSSGVRSGWFKSIQFALGLVSAYRTQRQQSREDKAHKHHDQPAGQQHDAGNGIKSEDASSKAG